MACLTNEQLAQLALESKDDTQLSAHVEHCPTCRSALAAVRRLTGQLSTAHAELARNHAAERSRLLANLSTVERPARRAGVWTRLASRLEQLTIGQRITVGGVGFSTTAAIVLVWLTFGNSAAELPAMERMVRAIREVNSYSYRLFETNPRPAKDDLPARTMQRNDRTYWRAPRASDDNSLGDLRSKMKIEWITQPARPAKQETQAHADIVEIYPSGEPGILIDYLAKIYYRVPPARTDEVPKDSPIAMLRSVRESSGQLVRDLGTKQIDGKEACGYVMTFQDVSLSEYGPVEVWIDPTTNLPIEFHFQATYDDGSSDQFHITDCQWNVELDSKLFDTTPPTGFLDVTLPNDEKSIAQVIAALKLYAELSGGRYPDVEMLDDRRYVTKFDAEACYQEMLQLAGFAGPERDEWDSDPSYQRIQHVRPGLATLERVLHNAKWLIGYSGTEVAAGDKDQVLMWWGVATENDKDEYRLFYGDLQTEVVPREKWVQFVPPEIAELTE